MELSKSGIIPLNNQEQLTSIRRVVGDRNTDRGEARNGLDLDRGEVVYVYDSKARLENH